MRAQNCCVLITKLTRDQNYEAVFSSFQVHAENNKTMTSKSLVTTFPQFSFYVESPNFGEIIASQSFANLLADLGNDSIEESLPTTKKAGTPRIEVREVANPRFVTEWISSLVAGQANSSTFPKRVVKKVRDDVVYYSTLHPFRRSGT